MNLIYCHGRSGSTQLIRFIKSLGDSGNVFDEPFKDRNAKRLGYCQEPLRRDLSKYIAWLNANYVKHLFSDLPAELNRKLVMDEHVNSILFLYRQNTLDYALSMVAARATNEWHGGSKSGDEIIDKDVLISEIEHLLKVIPKHVNILKLSGKPVKIVAYEELYSYNRSVRMNSVRDVFSHLNLPDEMVNTATDNVFAPSKKYKGENYYRRLFVNYDDIVEGLVCSEWYKKHMKIIV